MTRGAPICRAVLALATPVLALWAVVAPAPDPRVPRAAQARDGGRAAAPHRAGPGRQDCVSSGCHEKLGALRVAHKPIRDGTCEACHELTDEKNHKFKATATEPELCTQCHEKVTEGLAFLHGPVASGTCTACHDPHGSDHDMFLRKAPLETCQECHETVKAAVAGKAHKHKPAGDDCTFCHAAHGGADAMFLKAQGPALCLECHETLKDAIAKAPVPHDAVSQGRACVACHDAHASDFEKLLAGRSKDLCLSCHSEELRKGDRKIADIGGLLKANPVHHGPIRQDDCIVCHSEMHGGSHRALLMSNVTEAFYAPFADEAYALCFECHDAELAKAERTTDATKFRNGDRNLHYVHVNKKTKGRACRACHEVHGSVQPFQIRDSVPFGAGNWPLPIKYEKSEHGGSCAAGCHKPWAYDREKAVENIPPKPKPPG